MCVCGLTPDSVTPQMAVIRVTEFIIISSFFFSWLNSGPFDVSFFYSSTNKSSSKNYNLNSNAIFT